MSVHAASRTLAVVLVGAVLLGGCIPAGAAGHAPSARSAAPVAQVTPTPAPLPTVEPSVSPSPRASSTASPEPTPTPSPTPKPKPARGPVIVNLVRNPKAAFITEIRKTWCAASGTQMVLAFDGKVDLTAATQASIVKKTASLWDRKDSLTPGWGPGMIAKSLEKYGVPGYEVRTYKTRQAALLDAARAVERLHQPVLLMVWWGAHTWVMTGFKATQDPVAYKDAVITGTYVLDPWYPRISSIWGPSDPPGTFQNNAEMIRNYIRWTRPEGRYPGRDGQFVAVVPTLRAP